MTKDARIRARAVDVPDWWMALLNATIEGYRDADGQRLTQARLAERLSKHAKREEPWSQSMISYFLKGEKVTDDLVLAFSGLFSLPMPYFIAESEAEAEAFESVRRAMKRAAVEAVPPTGVDDKRPLHYQWRPGRTACGRSALGLRSTGEMEVFSKHVDRCKGCRRCV